MTCSSSAPRYAYPSLSRCKSSFIPIMSRRREWHNDVVPLDADATLGKSSQNARACVRKRKARWHPFRVIEFPRNNGPSNARVARNDAAPEEREEDGRSSRLIGPDRSYGTDGDSSIREVDQPGLRVRDVVGVVEAGI